jgi:hypothetical protein
MSQIDTPTDRLELPAEVCAELLSSRRRCRLLVTLAEGGEAAVVDLAAQLAAAEWGTEPGAVNELERQELRREIFDRHLPKLTATGVVEYDSLLGKLRLAEPAIVPDARRVLAEG